MLKGITEKQEDNWSEELDEVIVLSLTCPLLYDLRTDQEQKIIYKPAS